MSKTRVSLLLASALLLVSAAVPAQAQGGTATARLRGIEEVPALSTPGGGEFEATINANETEIQYRLHYFNVEGTVTQSHLHFAQKSVNGGIMIFLCSNLGNGPAGTQPCPTTRDVTITGTIHASDVIGGASSQGVAPGELFSAIRGIKLGVVYANVHSDVFPGGAIRGQVVFTPAP